MWLPRFNSQPGRGQAAVDQVGPVLDLLQLALDDADQAVQVGGGEVDHGPLEQRPDPLGRIKVRRVRGQPVHPQPFLVLRGEIRQLRRQVDVEVIPAPDQRGRQLAVGGDDQVLVILPGEALRLALAAVVHQQVIEQVRPVSGPVARHPGDADPAAAGAAHLHHRAGPAPGPGAAFRRAEPLACLVLEADEGAQVARGAFISGHTSAFHTATASSSRSIAWRTGTWQDQPCRRISFEVPSMVYPMWNSLPIKVLIRPRVQRWSPANPCASGPFLSSASSLVHCWPLSFSRDTGPVDLSARVPPSRQDLCQRRTDPSVTRRSCAISLIVSPRANRPAASSRSRSRRCCSAGVYPPRCAYRMPRSYASPGPASRPDLYEFSLVSRSDPRHHPAPAYQRALRPPAHCIRERDSHIRQPARYRRVPPRPGTQPCGSGHFDGSCPPDGRSLEHTTPSPKPCGTTQRSCAYGQWASAPSW